MLPPAGTGRQLWECNTMQGKKIAALDIATTTGWSVAYPGTRPLMGVIRFCPPGASHEEIGAAAIGWASDFFAVHQPDILVFEAPLPSSHMRGRTNANTARVLMGLVMVIPAVAKLRQVPIIREADVQDVRGHFIGTRRMKSAEAKAATMRRVKQLGWADPDAPLDHNAADAAAVWDYACAVLFPKAHASGQPLLREQVA